MLLIGLRAAEGVEPVSISSIRRHSRPNDLAIDTAGDDNSRGNIDTNEVPIKGLAHEHGRSIPGHVAIVDIKGSGLVQARGAAICGIEAIHVRTQNESI